MYKLFITFLCLFYSYPSFAGGSHVGPPGAQAELFLKGEAVNAVLLDDVQYFEMLSSIGSDEAVAAIGDLSFNTNIWLESLQLVGDIPLIKFYDDSGAESYFVKISSVENYFEKIEPSDFFEFKYVGTEDSSNWLVVDWQDWVNDNF